MPCGRGTRRHARGSPQHGRFGPPDPAFAEQVFFHDPLQDAHGEASAAIVNHSLGFGAFLRWRAAELPLLAQWKMNGAGEYVCGLEPSMHEMRPSRRQLRDEGLLRTLAPGESIAFRLELGALPDAEAVRGFEAVLD